MPAQIYLAGGETYVRVEDEPRDVLEAMNAAGGLPFRLTNYGGVGEVYVNPAVVAFWISGTRRHNATRAGSLTHHRSRAAVGRAHGPSGGFLPSTEISFSGRRWPGVMLGPCILAIAPTAASA